MGKLIYIRKYVLPFFSKLHFHFWHPYLNPNVHTHMNDVGFTADSFKSYHVSAAQAALTPSWLQQKTIGLFLQRGGWDAVCHTLWSGLC